MILKYTDTVARVQTGRATKFTEIMEAGWTEEEICLRFSDDQQAFVWNSKVKTALQKEFLKESYEEDGKAKVRYLPIPAKLTEAMLAFVAKFNEEHPLAFDRFDSEARGVGQKWLKAASESGTMKALLAAESEDDKAKIAKAFVKKHGVEPTLENIAGIIRKASENISAQY